MTGSDWIMLRASSEWKVQVISLVLYLLEYFLVRSSKQICHLYKIWWLLMTLLSRLTYHLCWLQTPFCDSLCLNWSVELGSWSNDCTIQQGCGLPWVLSLGLATPPGGSGFLPPFSYSADCPSAMGRHTHCVVHSSKRVTPGTAYC